MLKLVDNVELFSVLPQDAYAARIQALFKTYGAQCPFAEFWTQAENAAVCRVDGVMTLCCNENADYEELKIFIETVGCKTLVCSYEVCAKLGYAPSACSHIVEYTGDVCANPFCGNPDLKQMHSLLLLCGFTMGDYGSFLADFAARLNRGTAKTAVIASDSLDACASALFIGEKSVLLGAVATNPEKRGKGLASELVSALAGEMKMQGKRVFLFCREDSLLEFYKKIGFVACGKWTEVNFHSERR